MQIFVIKIYSWNFGAISARKIGLQESQYSFLHVSLGLFLDMKFKVIICGIGPIKILGILTCFTIGSPN
jgi:hypothetical protein